MQKEHMQKVIERVKNDFRLKKEFEEMSYFGFTEIMDKSMCLEEEKVNNEKLKGRFHLKIKK